MSAKVRVKLTLEQAMKAQKAVNVCKTFSVARKYAQSLSFITFNSYCSPRPVKLMARQISIFHRSASSQSRDPPISSHHSYGTVRSMYSSVTALSLTLRSGTNLTSLEYSAASVV